MAYDAIRIGIKHIIAMTGNSSVGEFDSYKAALRPLLFNAGNRIATDESALFVEFDKSRESRLHRRYIFVEFIAIKRESDLEAQCIAASKSAWSTTPRLNKRIPHSTYHFM